MNEIGSFIEMEFPKGREYYTGENVCRLNSGRAAIYHAARVLGCETVYLPYYQCDTVRDFLIKKEIQVRYYSIDEGFTPLIETIPPNEVIVIVNYFGIMSNNRLQEISSPFNNVIIDNSQGFFTEPLKNNDKTKFMNVYSARKFIGVPDGAYVIGNGSEQYTEDYEQDYSSDTSLFLLQRIEYGCEGKAYESRKMNEDRINNAGIKRMSTLTCKILDGTDYFRIIQKRKNNFLCACDLFCSINRIDPTTYVDNDCVPMVYPLLVEDDNLIEKLFKAKHFQGHWWSYLLNEVGNDTFEYWMSRYLIPITIDQRYDINDLLRVRNLL